MAYVTSILVAVILASSSLLVYQNCGSDEAVTATLNKLNEHVDIPKLKVKGNQGQKLVLRVPESLLGADKEAGFIWKHMPYKGDPIYIESTSYQLEIASFDKSNAGLFMVSLPRGAKEKDFLFVVDAKRTTVTDDRICTMIVTQMYNPATDQCVLATNGCKASDLREQGYETDSNGRCNNK